MTGRIPLRAILVGLLAQAAVIAWVVSSELPARVFISSWSVVMPALLLLVMMLAATGVVRRARPGAAASRGSILAIYIMVTTTTCIIGYAFLQVLLPSVAYPFFHATPENGWAAHHHLIPHWMAPRSPAVLAGMFYGSSPVPWRAWLVPMLCWGGFLLAVVASLMSLAALLSRQWVRRERLAFPIAQLPLELTREGTPLWRQPWLWIGIALPTVLESLLALQYYYPALPAIMLKHRPVTEIWFPTPPWSAMKRVWFGCSPFVIGLAYLVPTELSFSAVFFYWLRQLGMAVGSMMGWDLPAAGGALQGFPFEGEQAFGAFMALGLIALWRSRHDVAGGARRLVGRVGDAHDAAALAALATSLLVIVAVLLSVGVSLAVAAVLVALYLLICIGMTRIRAELGPPWQFGPPRNPLDTMALVGGAQRFSPHGAAGLGMFTWWFADIRFIPMPNQMEAYKLADEAGLRRSAITSVMGIAAVFGIALGMVACLKGLYWIGVDSARAYGAARWVGSGTASRIHEWLTNPARPDLTVAPWIGLGLAATVGLAMARERWIWFPFHPVGFAMANTHTAENFWFPYLMAFLVKTLVLRWGGNRLYRRTLPFFIGMIVGDILTQCLWSIGGALADKPVYQFIS